MDLYYPQAQGSNALTKLGDELRFVFITSDVRLHDVSAKPEGAVEVMENLWVKVGAASAQKCVRCWHHRADVGLHSEHPELCGRCIENIEGAVRFDSMRSFRSLSESAQHGMLGWLWLSAVVIAVDQLTKWMAEANLEFGVPVEVFPHFNLTLAYNEGAAFSFLANLGGAQRWLFAILPIAVSIFIIGWLQVTPQSNVG